MYNYVAYYVAPYVEVYVENLFTILPPNPMREA
jgi:hypothetical protein